MALKVQIDGQKKNITNSKFPPVTFINGEKKVLSHGITFINGEKKVIWGKKGWKIEIVKAPTRAAGQVIYISDNKAIIGGAPSSSSGVVTPTSIISVDISNPDIDGLADVYAWGGTIPIYSFIDSTATSMRYYITDNKLVSNVSNKAYVINTVEITPDGNISVIEASSEYAWGSSTYTRGFKVDSGWGAVAQIKSGSSYYLYYYMNGTQKYQLTPTASATNSIAKFGTDNVLAESSNYVKILNPTAQTDFGEYISNAGTAQGILVEENVVTIMRRRTGGSGSFADYRVSLKQYNKATEEVIWTWEIAGAQNDSNPIFLGKLAGYYLVEAYGTIYMIDENTGEVAYSYLVGVTTTINRGAVPHVSITGYLGYYNYDSVRGWYFVRISYS